jgi:hypothetical protein
MAVYRGILTVTNGVTTKVINHALANSAAVLSCATTGGWAGRPYITARDANNITVTFGVQAPGAGSLTIDVEVNS